jgi:hypothetical protein
MRSLLFAVLVCGACTNGVNGRDDPTVDAAAASDASSVSPDAASPDAPMMVNEAVARGEEWVAAMVPYCQAINHAPDYDSACSATCTRPDNAAWDPYRSDCSGFVSWAWGLPSTGGGRTTAEFAPFQNDITHVISSTDLQPGDAVNRTEAGHMMLFKAWITPGMEATFMEEPGCSSATPYAHEFTSSVLLMGDMIVVSNGTFTAIRRNP